MSTTSLGARTGLALAAAWLCACSSVTSRDAAPEVSNPSDANTVDASATDASTTDASTTDAGSVATESVLVYVTSTREAKVVALSLALATGELTELSFAALPVGRTVIGWAPGGRVLHALTTELTSFSANPTTGELRFLGSTPSGQGSATALTVAGDESWMLTSDYLQGTTWFRLSAEGLPLAPGSLLGNDTAPGVATMDGATAFLPTCEKDSITTYAWKDGQPSAISTVTLQAGSGPRQILLHPNRSWAYVLDAKSDAVTVLEHANGVLSNPQVVSTTPAGALPGRGDCALSGHLALHPSGRFAYVTRDSGNSVGVLALDQAGRPSFVGLSDHYLFRVADSLGVDPTGHFLLVGNLSGPLQVFAIDQTKGTLTFVANAAGVSSVTSLAFAPR